MFEWSMPLAAHGIVINEFKNVKAKKSNRRVDVALRVEDGARQRQSFRTHLVATIVIVGAIACKQKSVGIWVGILRTNDNIHDGIYFGLSEISLPNPILRFRGAGIECNERTAMLQSTATDVQRTVQQRTVNWDPV